MNYTNLFGAGTFDEFSNILKDLIGQMWAPCLGIAGALAALWGLYIGWKFWSAGGDDQKKKSAKSALVSFVIGILVIFIIAVGAPILISALAGWMQDNSGTTVRVLMSALSLE